MVGVGEQNAGAGRGDHVRGQRLDGRRRPDRHERRGRHRPVCHLEHARARRAVRCDDPKHRTSYARFGPFQEARVAIGVEAIPVSQGVRVGGLHAVGSRESANQHKQRRARQVEIGQQQIGDSKPKAGF